VKCRKGRFKSHDLVVEQWDLASEAYKEILRVIYRDNDERMCLTVNDKGRIKLDDIRAVKGSVLAAVTGNTKEQFLHKLVFAYAHGADAVASLSIKRGGKTLDHRNCNKRDNNPENLWALAHELNNFRNSETTERKAGGRFVLPMHTFMVDRYKYLDENGNPCEKKTKNPNPRHRKFKAPFTKELMDSHPSGKILRETYGYDENMYYKIARAFTTDKSAHEIELTFNTIVKHLCRFLLHLIEHPDRPLEALGLGWRDTAKANNITYLRERLVTAETRIVKLNAAMKEDEAEKKSKSKKRKREDFAKLFGGSEKEKIVAKKK